MPTTPTADRLAKHFRQTLRLYDEALLRQVAQKLCRPRNQWPADELAERIVTALANPAMLDRRLKELPVSCRQLLALIGHSRQPCWNVGALVEMAVALGHADGLAPIVELLGTGLLVPALFAVDSEPDRAERLRVKSFEQWLTLSSARPARVLTYPLATARVVGSDVGLPDCPGATAPDQGRAMALQSDGLEWPLRLAALHQQVTSGPLRCTQQGDFFKRDLERLRADPLFTAGADAPVAVPDAGLFVVSLAVAAGVLREADAELVAGAFSEAWQQALPALLSELWASLPSLRGWDAGRGWHPDEAAGNRYASAGLLSLVLLTRLPEEGWADPVAIEAWILAHHPYWREGGVEPPGTTSFLLGVAYLLRLVEARPAGGTHLVRLSATGRWLLGLADAAPASASFPQTLLVQPNLEILAYRQGLAPPLIVALGRFANWKGLGPACTLQLDPQSVYRGLETGESFASIVQTLERHGMKTLPPAVLDSLRTWSNKRERITVYPSAALFEFASATELSEAIARGVPAQRLTDRLAVVPAEQDIDFRHFRLTGTRDYCLPPERCVDVEADGVTLNVDLVRSDLLLEIEVQRFAEPTSRAVLLGRRLYRLTPESLNRARDQGVTPAFLARWFEQRTGLPLPPAARLLLTAVETPPLELRRQIVLHVADAELADGLQQWPGTRSLIHGRLGPTALAVSETHVEALAARLQELGIRLMRDEI